MGKTSVIEVVASIRAIASRLTAPGSTEPDVTFDLDMLQCAVEQAVGVRPGKDFVSNVLEGEYIFYNGVWKRCQ